MSSGGIPFSQAPGSRRDERIGGVEDRASRSRELPARDQWVLSPLPLGMVLNDQTMLTADLIRFYFLGQFTRETSLRQVRLNISTAAAGQTVRAALYRYDTENVQHRQLVKLADSEALFSAATAGVISVALRDGAQAQPGFLFLGVKASNDAVGVGGLDPPSVDRTMPIYTYQDNPGILVSVVAMPLLTKSYTGRVLDVLYISPDAAQVI